MEPRSLREMGEHEQRWLGHAREMEGRDEMAFPRQPPAGKGGGGAAVECVQVIGMTSGNAAFRCKRLDDDGAVTGDEITVYAMTQPAGADLALCFPFFAVGSLMRVQQQDNFLGGAWVSGLYCIDTLQLTSCQVAGS